MVQSLYSQDDVRNYRNKLVTDQQGVDPILNESFKEVVVCDHDHTSQHCRAALNRNTNAFEGLVFNAYKRCLSWLTDKPLPEILRNLASYLEKDYTGNPYHPDWMKNVKTKFNKLTSQQMDSVLLSLGSTKGKNLAERKKLFAKQVLRRDLGYTKILEAINHQRK